jgi:hypothetical protein
VLAEQARDGIQREYEMMTMACDGRWKLVSFSDADDGQLFDLVPTRRRATTCGTTVPTRQSRNACSTTPLLGAATSCSDPVTGGAP